MWDPVPWLVGGGAEHSPEVGRLLAYIALSGAEGIVGSGDLKVSALASPGGAIQVAPGACSVLNRAATGGSLQAYAARKTATETVNIAPTGAGSGRSDLIVARVEDPFVAGSPYQNPADPKVGPYIFTRVISGVAAGTKVPPASAGSCIALARIDLPANTSSVTAGMVTDLRKVARPRRERNMEVVNPSDVRTLTSTSFTTLANSVTFDIPAWATRATIVVTLSGLRAITAPAVGELRATLGTAATQPTVWDENGTSNVSRTTYVVGSEVNVSALKGTTQTLSIQGRRTSGTGALQADTGTTYTVDVEFTEKPE